MANDTEQRRAHLGVGLVLAAAIAVSALAVGAALRRGDRSDGFARALAHYGDGRWRAAEEGFRASADAAGLAGEAARFNLGLALYRDGRFGEATGTFVALAGAESRVVRVRACFNEGNCAYRRRRLSGAAEAYRNAIAGAQRGLDRLPEDAAVVEALSQVRERARHNLSLVLRAERAGATSDTAQMADPGDPPASPGGENVSEEPLGVSQRVAGAADGGTVSMEGALSHVLSRDTGPQFRRAGFRARPGGKDW